MVFLANVKGLTEWLQCFVKKALILFQYNKTPTGRALRGFEPRPGTSLTLKNDCDMETINHQFRSLYNDNVFCDIIGYCLNGNAKCIVTTYGKRGKTKKVQQSLPADCLEGPFANFKRMNG